MIELAKASISISAPIHAVFDYVTNMENYKEWFPGVVKIASANSLNHAEVGKKYTETLSLASGESQLVIEVVKSESGQLFVTQGDLAGILPQMTIHFSVTDEQNCHVQLQYHARCSSLSESSGMVSALREDLKVRAQKATLELKAILEAV